MKKRNSSCDYIPARNEELKSEFYSRLSSRTFLRTDDIFADIAKAGAKRFYITEDRAYVLLCNYNTKGEWPKGMNPLRRRMMADIKRRVAALMDDDPSLSLKDAVYKAVNSEAPAFYLTPRSIRTIVYGSLSA